MRPAIVDAVDFTDFYPQEQQVEEERPIAYNHHPQQQYNAQPRRQYQPGHSPHHSPVRGSPYQGRGRGGRGRGGGHPYSGSSTPPAPLSASSGEYFRSGTSPFVLPIADAAPIQPPAFLVKEEREGPTSPHRPVAPVAHLVSRSIRRANAPPLGVNIFYGALGGFLEEHGSDVVLASSFKGAFRTANAPTSFCSAAQTCGVDVATLEYKDFVSADYNLHMLEPEQHCGALWLVELKQSTPLSPFKPKDLVECYDMLKLHAREIIQEDTLTLTMPLIGKGAKANHFQIGRNEVIVELVGFLHWIAENMSDRPNLAAINIVSSNNFTAHALQSAFDLLIPVQLDKLEDIIKQAMAKSAQALAQFEGELKKLEQADKAEREEERRLAREQNGSAPSAESERPDWERRATQREKREMRKKLDDIVTKLRIVHKSVANILAAVQAFKAVREVSIIIVACAVNGRIVAELCSELFLLDDGLLRQQQPQPGGRGAGGRGRGFGAPYADAGRGRGRGFAGQPGAGAGPAPALAPPPAMAMAPDQNLFGRMTQLKASGKIEKELYHHFQTLRLIGNKAVHSTVLKATTVDLGAIVLAVHGLITCPHFS